MAKRKIGDIPIADEEGPETKKIKLDEGVSESHLQCSISALPIEIVSEYIFKYFDFQKCLETLVPVCKQWHLAAQVSTVPKQLVVRRLGNNFASIGSALSIYGVNTLVLNPTKKEASLCDLAQMLNTAPKLTTLVCKSGNAFEHEMNGKKRSMSIPSNTSYAFDHIKTLSIADLNDPHLLTKFPNVTQLKIEALWTAYKSQLQPGKVAYPNVIELELNVTYSTPLENITEYFPGLKTLYINDLGNTVAMQALNNISEALCIKIVPNRDPHDLTTLSYSDYFNACGRSALDYFIGKKNTAKVIELLSKFTNETYEQDLLARQPQFKFPTRSSYFEAKASAIKKSSLSKEMILTLVENGGLSYWSAFAFILDLSTIREMLSQANKYRPVTSETVKAVVKLNCHQSVPVNQIVELVGEGIFKEIATARDTRGNTLLHLLARKSANLPMYWDKLIPYSDIHALNDKKENAATIAFYARYWACWQMLVEQGVVIQQEKYVTDLVSTRHLLSWILTTATSFRVLKHFKGCDTYLQTMFFQLQYINLPRKHFLFRKLLKLGADPKQFNHVGQSLLNVLVEQTSNTLIDEWDSIAECALDLNEYDKSGRTPLITAIKLGSFKIAKFLLEKGADPNAPGITSRGNNIYPVQLEQTLTDDNVIKLLAEHGADFTTLEDMDGNTILNATIAKHKFIEIKSLAAFVSINKPNKHNMTPLAKSICIADLTKVQACLASGADVNQISGPLMQSPLLLALEADEQPIVQCLLETQKVDVTLRDKAGRSFVNYLLRTEPLFELNDKMMAVIGQYGTPENIAFVKNEVEAILNNPHMSVFGTKILKFATSKVAYAKFFVTVLGIDTNIQDSNGDTMLSLIEFHPRESPPVIDFLVSHGANINHQNKQKNTPLMKAMDIIARDTDDEHIKVLLRHGASVELKNIWGLSPMDVEPTILQKLS